MRRTASILGLTVLFIGVMGGVATGATCWYNDDNELVCEDDGGTPGTPGNPGDTDSTPRVGPRYVHTAVDPVIGDCHFWSNTPGGLDSWNPADDAAVITANFLPECPGGVPPVDVPATAWQIFRSWTLAAPTPSLQPSDHGITGLPTFLASPEPIEINHSETLPDGRPLSVRARVVELRVDWGDDTRAIYDASGANAYPSGTVTHTYRTKTCPPEYRREHPSGGLCHPTLSYYTIAAIYRWVGEYDIGSVWIQLGTLDRTASVAYDVDEVRGVPVPSS